MAIEFHTLDSLCSLIVDCPHSTPVWTNSGVLVLRSQNIRNGRLNLDQPSFTDEAHYQERIRRAAPREGDVVITREAPMGEVCMVPANLRCCLGQRMVLLRPDPKKVDGRYLLLALQSQSVRNQISWAEGTGSTVSNLRIPDLKALKIPYRKIDEQRTISHILGTLDDKIELNRKMNETLESMARALFKSWFIDFDPVRAKMDGRWKKGQSLPGLPAELWDLFPERFVELSSGLIPDGWSVGTFGEVAQEVRRSITPKDIAPDTPYIGLEHMPRRSVALSDWGNSEGLESNKLRFRSGEILFGKLRPYFHKVGVAPVDGVCSTDIVVLEPKKSEWHSFVLSTVSSDEFVNFTNSNSTGTKMPRTSWGDMERFSCILPNEELAAIFHKHTKPLVQKLVRNIHEVRDLAALRDSLLPKLISGEISVKELVHNG